MIVYILIGIACLIAIILAIAAFSKKSYSVSREITIDKPINTVYEYVRFLKNEEKYNKWVMADPNMNKTFSNTDGEIGFVYAWDSPMKNVGKGEQEIKQLTQNKRVECEIRFERPFKAVAQTVMTINPVAENRTLVTWSMSSEMKYPMNAMLLFMNMDKMLGKDLEISLRNLKQNLESNNQN